MVKKPEKKPDPTPEPPKVAVTPVTTPKPVVKPPVTPKPDPVVVVQPNPNTSVSYGLPTYALNYTSQDFASYDWSSDRRFTANIFGPIDANIAKIRSEITAK